MPLKVVVCGAGPVGCATALRIARMPKTEVTLMEKRSLTELVELSASKRAYCMAIRPRGKQALDALDIVLPSTQHPMQGVTMLPSGQEVPVWSKGALARRRVPASALVRWARSIILFVHPEPDGSIMRSRCRRGSSAQR